MLLLNIPHIGPLRFLAALAIMVGLSALAACSFSPVYGGSNAQRYNLSFAESDSRLSQIVYQDLAARFGRSSAPDALHVSVKISSSSLQPGQSSAALEGDITVTRPHPAGGDPQVIYQGTRTASATYNGSSQALARQQASNEAAERAAHQLAETIRLTLMGVLADHRAAGPASVVPVSSPIASTQTGQ